MKKLLMIILLILTCSMYAKDTWVYQPLLEEKLVRIPKSAQYDTYTKAEIDGKDTAVLDSSETFTTTKLEDYTIKSADAGTNTTVDITDGVLKVNAVVTPPTDLSAYTKTADFPEVPCIAKNISDIKLKANIGDSYLKAIADSRFQLKGDYIADAPVDGKQYARRDADWSEVATTDGYWYLDKLTEDVTCDTDVSVKGKLYIDGPISFDGNFWMNTEKVSHTNTIPSFNVDTKQVEFVPMGGTILHTYQQIPLKNLVPWEATYSEDGHKAQPTIIMGTGTQDYCTVSGDVLVPPKTLSITLTFTYTIKGFGWLPNPEWKPLPPITITGNIDNPHDNSGISLEFCKSDIHWSTDQKHRGSRTYTIDTSNKGLSTFSYEHMNFTFMGTGIKQDADNSWQMTGCAVSFTVAN